MVFERHNLAVKRELAELEPRQIEQIAYKLGLGDRVASQNLGRAARTQIRWLHCCAPALPNNRG